MIDDNFSMDLNVKIYIAGHRGMVGSAIQRILQKRGYKNVVTRKHAELDLTNQEAVKQFFNEERPDQVYLAAAKVGGIHANDTYPADFIYQNLMIQSNVIHQAFMSGVRKLLFLGSSCIYPKFSPQPMTEEILLTGKLEPTNEPYAIAKIAGIKLCESYNRQYASTHSLDYRSVMPTNLYGPGDNYHPENSHVIPALIRRFHEAKVQNLPTVSIWGSGNARREFLHVNDMAAAAIHVMDIKRSEYDRYTTPMCSHINVGCGFDISIAELSGMLSEVIGYRGEIVFDANKPDGAPKKLMDSSKIHQLGWSHAVEIKEGLLNAYADFIKNHWHSNTYRD